MLRYKKHFIQFFAGLGLAVSIGVGVFAQSEPAVALAGCPAYPTAPGGLCPYEAMCGYVCTSGVCDLRPACDLPPYNGQGGLKDGHQSCGVSTFGCTLSTPCVAGCVI